LVLFDFGMPKMNGLDVIKNAAPASPNTKFIVISAHKDRETILQAATQGIAGYLTKPVRLEELRQRVNAALEQPIKPTKTFKIADQKSEHDKPFVLVCDQHPSMQSLFKNLLEGEGAEVALVSNPDVALRVLSANYPHIVIIDSELKPGGALPLVKTLRAPGIPKIPLFILADPKDKSWQEKANYYGIRKVLNKPLRLDELKKAYHETISQVEVHNTIPVKKDDILRTLVMQQKNSESTFNMKDFAMLFVNHMENHEKQNFKERLEENDEANVRQIIINLLTRKKEPQRLQIIDEAYKRGDFKVRYNCLDLLGRFISMDNRVAILIKLVKDPDYRIRMIAAEQLAALPGDQVKQALLDLIGDEVWQVRKKAITLIEKVSDNLLYRPLIAFYAQEKMPFPPKLKTELSRAKSPADLKPVYDILSEDQPDIKEHVIRNLVDIGTEFCLHPIVKCLHDPTASVRSSALQAVRVIRRPEVFEAILPLTSDVEAAIRQEAVVYIENYPLQPCSKALLVGRARDRQPLDDALLKFIKINEADHSMLATRLVNMNAISQEEQKILTELLRRVYDAPTTSIFLDKLYRGAPGERAEIVQDIVNKIMTSSWSLLS
jgi:DNA-binding response OmpR family regulator